MTRHGGGRYDSAEARRLQREANPAMRIQHRRYVAARGRALRRLGAVHLDELETLLDAELAKLGYTGRIPHPSRVRSAGR